MHLSPPAISADALEEHPAVTARNQDIADLMADCEHQGLLRHARPLGPEKVREVLFDIEISRHLTKALRQDFHPEKAVRECQVRLARAAGIDPNRMISFMDDADIEKSKDFVPWRGTSERASLSMESLLCAQREMAKTRWLMGRGPEAKQTHPLDFTYRLAAAHIASSARIESRGAWSCLDNAAGTHVGTYLGQVDTLRDEAIRLESLDTEPRGRNRSHVVWTAPTMAERYDQKLPLLVAEGLHLSGSIGQFMRSCRKDVGSGSLSSDAYLAILRGHLTINGNRSLVLDPDLSGMDLVKAGRQPIKSIAST